MQGDLQQCRELFAVIFADAILGHIDAVNITQKQSIAVVEAILERTHGLHRQK